MRAGILSVSGHSRRLLQCLFLGPRGGLTVYSGRRFHELTYSRNEVGFRQIFVEIAPIMCDDKHLLVLKVVGPLPNISDNHQILITQLQVRFPFDRVTTGRKLRLTEIRARKPLRFIQGMKRRSLFGEVGERTPLLDRGDLVCYDWNRRSTAKKA